MNVNRGKMTAGAVLAVTLLVVGRCDRIWFAQGRNGGTALWRMAD